MQVLSDFDHDVNPGTSDLLKFVDVAAAAQGLRRRGIFYSKNALRMYLPGELRQHGLPINLRSSHRAASASTCARPTST